MNHATRLAALAALLHTGAAAADDGLTWNGLTLYGTLDLGIAHQTHGTPLSQDWFVGVEYLLAKNSNKPVTSLAPSGLSQSRLGLRGSEPLLPELDFVFNLEVGFDPQSGNLADALASLVHNNGVPLDRQTSAGDSSRAGQLFNGPAWAGIGSERFGTVTLGRNNTLLLDDILKYDPMGGAYAFSVIGLSGVVAGMGATEDARLDDSVKYFWKRDAWHAGALYQFDDAQSSPGGAWQATAGFDAAGFSVDAVVGHKNDAIAAKSLTAAQLATAPRDSLAATVSDNTAYTLAASYALGAWKVFAGYERMRFENPSRPLMAGIHALGGYQLSFVDNTAFPHPRILQASWGGVRHALSKQFDVTGAFYHYDQNGFGETRCANAASDACSGTLDAYSLMADYRLTKRSDVYAGAMFSRVADGLASGYLHTSTLSTMTGFRFRF